MTVNDGDTLTIGGRAHPAARHRCAGIRPDLPQDGARLSPAAQLPRGACRADRRPAGFAAPGGSATATTGCSRSAGRRRQRPQRGPWSRRAGRSPMATIEAEQDAAARQRRRPLGGRRSSGPRDWRETHGGMAEIEHVTPGSILDWLRRMLRLSVQLRADICRRYDEAVRRGQGAQSAPRAHLPGREGHRRCRSCRSTWAPWSIAAASVAARNPLQRLPVLELDDGTIAVRIGRDLPLFRGDPAGAGAVRARRARQGAGRDVAAAHGAQPVRCRWPPRSATSIRP